jgi:hypothetical protein
LAKNKNICMICAWRQTCIKRFSIAQDSKLRCPDFTRDVTIKEEEEEEKNQSTEKEREP